MRETIPFTIAVKNIKDLEIPLKINVQNLWRKLQNFTVGHIKEHK